MAKSGIKFSYLSGGPGSITSIICLSSSPRLGGTVILSPFSNLTAFNGGDNNITLVTGISSLTALKSFTLTGVSLAPITLDELPNSLLYFNVSGSGAKIGNLSVLPPSLQHFQIEGVNNTTRGNLNDLPDSLNVYINTSLNINTSTLANTTSGNIGNLPRGLTYYHNAGVLSGVVINGTLNSLPSGLTFFRNEGNNSTSGQLSGLPRGLTYYYNNGVNTTSGDLSGLPRSLMYYYNEGRNTTSGDLSGLPTNLTYYNNAGNNTTTGILTGLPANLEIYINTGSNTVSGDLSHLPTSLVYFWHGGDSEGLLTGNLSALSTSSSLESIIVQNNTITGDLSSLPSSLESYTVLGSNTVSGTLNSLPSGLTFFDSRGSNTISGNLSSLPDSLIEYNNSGVNTVFGNLENLPRGLIVLGCGGSSTTTGDLSTLPTGLTSYSTIASSTVFGDIGTLPRGLTSYQNLGSNTTRGDIGDLPEGLTYYRNVGSNTTEGNIENLPENLETYINAGNNTTTGNLSGLPSSLTQYDNRGNNTTTGNLSSLPSGIIYYNNEGVNTTTGNLSSLNSNLTYYNNRGNNTVYNYYNGASLGFGQKSWANGQKFWFLQPALSSFVPGVTDYIPGQPLDADTVAFANNIPSMSNEEKMYIDMFVLGCKVLGLWNDMVCWPLLNSQNSGTDTVYSLGGSGTFNGVLTGSLTQPNHNLQWTGQGLFSSSSTNRVTTQKQRSNYNQRTFYAVGWANQANYLTRARYMHSGYSEAQFLSFRQSINGMHLNDTINGLDQYGAGIAFTATFPLTGTAPVLTVPAIPRNSLNTWATHAATFSNRTLRNYRDAILRGTGVGGSWADSITDGEVLTLMNSQERTYDSFGENAGLRGYMAFGADFDIGLTENQVVAFDYLYKLTLGRSLPLVKLVTTEVPGMSPYHLATLVIDLSGVTWEESKAFSADGPNNPLLNLVDYSYGTQLSAAVDAIRNKGVTVSLNLTAFLDPDAEAYKTLIS